MNLRLVSRSLGLVALLIAASMAVSLPWALPTCSGTPSVEYKAISALLGAIAISVGLGLSLVHLGRGASGRMFRKEALAIAGLSWCLATVLGGMPYLFSGTSRGDGDAVDATGTAADSRMGVVDALFESASGFSGTGATVITDLEDPQLVPRAILFWRSASHFLGGLGIMVLFVALLGQGSAGKAVMRAELPGPSKDSSHTRVQHIAWTFAGIYVGLNVVLASLLLLLGLNVFDALCHAFGTIATGGFSTYNDSVGHFQSPAVEMTITAFMAISCVNFALLFFALTGHPERLFGDAEFRIYLLILLSACGLAVGFGWHYGDFGDLPEAFRYGLFQVTSIMTNTGFGTHDFNDWNEFGRGLLFVLMFVGGCTGSTSCSVKVVRYLILAKTLSLEVERTYHPHVVRPLRVGGEVAEPNTARDVCLYFTIFLGIAVVAWILLLAFEPDRKWQTTADSPHEKLMDCASAVAATINGVGPGLGIVGATQNYAHFQPASKLLLSFLMLIGRLEVFPIIVLLAPGFWRRL